MGRRVNEAVRSVKCGVMALGSTLWFLGIPASLVVTLAAVGDRGYDPVGFAVLAVTAAGGAIHWGSMRGW